MSEPAKTPDDVRRALREHGATVIDDATDPVIIFDQSERIVDVNDAAVATFGYERDELLGHAMAKLAPPGATEAVENGAFRSSREGLAVADVLRRKDGVCFPAICSTRLLLVGGSDYAELIVRDLAGHEDPTLRDLPWQMAREWSLFQHMPSGYALCRRVVDESGDIDFVFVDVNPAFANITRERDVVGRPVSEAMPTLWEVAPELRRLVDRVIDGGEPGMIELFVPPYEIWISATVHSPAPEHVVVVFDDVTSRRQAEEDRRATAELLRGIFEHSGASIGLWSLDGYMIMCNRLGAGDLGGEPSDYVGRSALDIFGEEEGALYLERMKRAAETGEVSAYEERGRADADGVTRWYRGIYAPVLDGEGRATAVEALGVDITERKAAEDALRDSEHYLDSVIENSPIALSISDETGRFVRANQAWRDVFGIADEVAIKNDYSILTDEAIAREGYAPLVRRVFEEGETVRFKMRYNERELHELESTRAEPLVVDVTVSPVLDARGRLAHTVAQYIDVTDRERTLQELIESQQRLDGVFRTSPTGIYITRQSDGVLLNANDAFARMFGMERDEVVGRTTVEIGMFRDVEARERAVARTEPTGIDTDYEAVIRTRSGESRTVILAAAMLQSGGESCIVGTMTDITERKAIETELQRLNVDLERRVEERTEELRASNADLEAFSYSVSHDLRAPLRHASGFARLLVDDFGDDMPERASKHLGKVVDSVKQMGDLIDELLQFSRAGRGQLSFRWVDMNKLVSEARDMLEDDCEGRRISWSVAALPQVWGDGSMLCQAWVNLLGNAVKYTRPREEARIAVDAHETPDEYEFVIRDNGVGFEMQYVDKLFGVFQRLSADPQFEGVGIGLANVRRIITRHGGRTWGRGEPDVGAELGFSLPKRQETRASL